MMTTEGERVYNLMYAAIESNAVVAYANEIIRLAPTDLRIALTRIGASVDKMLMIAYIQGPSSCPVACDMRKAVGMSDFSTYQQGYQNLVEEIGPIEAARIARIYVGLRVHACMVGGEDKDKELISQLTIL